MEFITPKLFAEIAELEAICFNRSIRNIELQHARLNSNPNGCFAITQNNTLVGFVFTKILGQIGTIGPLAVNPKFQGNKLGQSLLNHAIEYLKSVNCREIGLEVSPNKGDNIGLYLKSNFMPTLPTINFTKNAIEFNALPSNLIVDLKTVNKNLISKMDDEFSFQSNGFSLKRELAILLQQSNSSIYGYIKNNKLEGFLAFSHDYPPFAIGYFLKGSQNKLIFNALVDKVSKNSKIQNLCFSINSYYNNFLDTIDLKYYNILSTTTRMILNGYNTKNSPTSLFLAHSFIG